MLLESELYALLGRRLRLRRRQLNMTQGQLGRACDLSLQVISKYEGGQIAMSVGRMVQFADAMGVPVSYFVDHLPERRDSSRRDPVAQSTDLADSHTA